MSGLGDHIPVLLDETVAALAPSDGELFVDGTFGRGGVSRALLGSADCTVLAIDRDETAAQAAMPLVEQFGGRFQFFMGRFSEMEALLGRPPGSVNGVTVDVGVSSPQLDQPERGFSFQTDGPLDMRMGISETTASDIVNAASEKVLAQVLRIYGEERRANRIAKAIIQHRDEAPILRTRELAAIVEKTIPRRPTDKVHPATKTFQALRLAVNDELRELALGLSAAERLLAPGGRLAVVSFHSMEARIVKRFFSERSKPPGSGSRHLPETVSDPFVPQFEMPGGKPMAPSKSELERNPRSRSAQLRWGVRTAAPSRPIDFQALNVPEVEIL